MVTAWWVGVWGEWGRGGGGGGFGSFQEERIFGVHMILRVCLRLQNFLDFENSKHKVLNTWRLPNCVDCVPRSTVIF